MAVRLNGDGYLEKHNFCFGVYDDFDEHSDGSDGSNDGRTGASRGAVYRTHHARVPSHH